MVMPVDPSDRTKTSLPDNAHKGLKKVSRIVHVREASRGRLIEKQVPVAGSLSTQIRPS